MNEYLATFHSHFGALSFRKALKERGIAAKLGPVPRKISPTCGTCVFYAHDSAVPADGFELEALYVERNGAWELVYNEER